MEFKEEQVIAQHVCDDRCNDPDNGHHAWPSPSVEYLRKLAENEPDSIP